MIITRSILWGCAIFFFWWVKDFLQFSGVPFQKIKGYWVSLKGVSHSFQRIGATFKHKGQLRQFSVHGHRHLTFQDVSSSGFYAKQCAKWLGQTSGHQQWGDRGPHRDGPCSGGPSSDLGPGPSGPSHWHIRRSCDGRNPRRTAAKGGVHSWHQWWPWVLIKKTTGQINSICQNDWKHMKTHSIIASSYQSKSLAPGYVKEPPAIRQEFEPPKPAVQGQIPRSLFGGWGYQLERWWIWYGGFLQMGLPQ